MNKDILYVPKAPYLHIIEASVSEVTDFAWSLADQSSLRLVVRLLRGNKMTRVGSLFDEFAAALQFPYYFGENWNAFDECITDLEWLAGAAYILVITNSEALLSEDAEEELEILISILQKAGHEWSQIVETSEAWGRPAVAFHVIFQCDSTDKQEVMSRIKRVGASFQDINI